MIKRVILFVIFLNISQVLFAQDPVFSQYYNTPSLINPAFVGNSNSGIISTNYRLQWPGLSSPYKTFGISFSKKFENLGGGLGFNVLSDNAGDGILKSNKFSGIYSYILRVDDNSFIKGAVNAGYVFKSLDWNKLVFGDAIDPVLGGISPGGSPYPSQEIRPENNNVGYMDAGVGFLYYNPNIYGGVSMDHINRPTDKFLATNNDYKGIPVRFGVQLGGILHLEKSNKLNNGTFISPSILYVKQGDFSQLNVNGYISLDKLLFGLGYRHASTNGDAVILTAGLRQYIYKISYSFDYTVSDLSINQGGSHELGLFINFDLGKPQRIDYNDCLKLFR
jgi:type IX secretion system PorP/SprF family membrane protein